jgi:hypothetical protein
VNEEPGWGKAENVQADENTEFQNYAKLMTTFLDKEESDSSSSDEDV